MTRADAGYSLLELMVVLAIASLLAVLVAPRVVSSMAAGTDRLDTERLVSTLGTWRAQATNTETAVRAFVLPATPNVLRSSVAALEFDTDTRVETFPGQITFYADGSTSGGEIRLTRGGTARHIYIEPVSGRIATGAP